MNDVTALRKGAKGFEGLQVWQKSMHLAVRICKDGLSIFPSSEMYALTSQLRRAVQSIPANIAEGHRRFHYQESIRYCYIARGSIHEVMSHIEYAKQMGYLPDQLTSDLKEHAYEIQKMLHGCIDHGKRSKQGQNEPGYRIADLPADVQNHVHDDQSDLIEDS